MPTADPALRDLAVLVVEDSLDDYELLGAALRRVTTGVHLQRVEAVDELRAALPAREWDVVVSDHHLPTMTSQDALGVVRAHDPMLPFLIVSGELGVEAAVAAMQAGADDYVM